jgi:VWA domain-containing protein
METARQVVGKVVDDLTRRLEHNTRETLRGALNRSQRTRRPRRADIDWPRTIGANLRHYQPQHRTVVPQTLIGHARHTKTRAELDHVNLCIDQSGSMATSVVYSSIFAAVMASIPGLSTKLICFDTSIVHLTWQSTSDNPTAFFEECLSVSRTTFLKSSGRDRALALATECRIWVCFCYLVYLNNCYVGTSIFDHCVLERHFDRSRSNPAGVADRGSR